MTDVYFEVGKKRVFASALDWPGWCRRGRSEEDALQELTAYRARYAAVAGLAGLSLPPDAGESFAVTERVESTGGYADFGVPGHAATSDARPIDAAEAGRLAELVRAAWTAFDQVVERVPEELRKGPRGGGRDRTAIVEHVVRAEASSYARHLGVALSQPAAAGDGPAIAAARDALLAAIAQPRDGGGPNRWPTRYAARRVAWHVLDHAWEMEDRAREP